MANKKNKVKFGLSNVYFAKITFDEDANATFATPVRIPGAVNLSMDPEGEPEVFWADNIAYYVISNNSGYTGDLEIALVPEEFAQEILHEELDSNGVMAENTDAEVEHFGLLFEFSGDVHKTRHVLYNCTCARPTMESATTEDSKEVQTETLSLTAMPLANGYVKAKTCSSTSSDVYDSWYSAVYEPQAAAETTSDDDTEEADG